MRAIVDTNVAVVANGKSPQADLLCVRACVEQLLSIQRNGKIVLDEAWEVIREYRDNLSEHGQPGMGDAFFLWVLQNWKNPNFCELYALTIEDHEPREFIAFPKTSALKGFDPADKKFVALAVVAQAPIYTAVDPGFWDYKDALAAHNISVEFVCPDYFG